MSIELRPIRPEDQEFLYCLYASTRQEELAPLAWAPAQQEAFLRMQFNAQRSHYQQHFPDASFSVILRDGQPAGRLYLDTTGEKVCVIDIALLPEHRSQGIGAMLMGRILADADAAGKAVSIHVERSNRALRFYDRLGFAAVQDLGVYFRMERPSR